MGKELNYDLIIRNIKFLLEKNNLSQRQLDIKLGCSPDNAGKRVCRWMRKGIKPSYKNLIAISEIFKIPLNHLLEDDLQAIEANNKFTNILDLFCIENKDFESAYMKYLVSLGVSFGFSSLPLSDSNILGEAEHDGNIQIFFKDSCGNPREMTVLKSVFDEFAYKMAKRNLQELEFLLYDKKDKTIRRTLESGNENFQEMYR